MEKQFTVTERVGGIDLVNAYDSNTEPFTAWHRPLHTSSVIPVFM